MRSRKLAAVGAISTVLATAAVGITAASAYAEHEVPETLDGNVSCVELDLESLFKDDTPADADNEFVIATISEDGTRLDVEPKDGVLIGAVLVKGGTDTNVYRTSPFHEMYAPENDGGNIPEISHYEICAGVEEPEPTPSPSPTPTDEPEPTETPSPSPTDEPEPTETPSPSPSDEPTPTEAPTDDETPTPVPVPTRVPAGV